MEGERKVLGFLENAQGMVWGWGQGCAVFHSPEQTKDTQENQKWGLVAVGIRENIVCIPVCVQQGALQSSSCFVQLNGNFPPFSWRKQGKVIPGKTLPWAPGLELQPDSGSVKHCEEKLLVQSAWAGSPFHRSTCTAGLGSGNILGMCREALEGGWGPWWGSSAEKGRCCVLPGPIPMDLTWPQDPGKLLEPHWTEPSPFPLKDHVLCGFYSS